MQWKKSTVSLTKHSKGGQKKVQLQAFPFRMTAQNLASHAGDPNMPFWRCSKPAVTRSRPRSDRRESLFAIDDMSLILLCQANLMQARLARLALIRRL